jgi:hypothetical protein
MIGILYHTLAEIASYFLLFSEIKLAAAKAGGENDKL